jgi:ubiquinone/menaquinone biosynthesis C-methylase UbiE
MGIIGNLIYFTISSKEKVEKYQQIIRDEEWKWLVKEIPSNTKFLDVGCGAGYAMYKAETDLSCHCYGIDPDPGAHGVGRYLKNMVSVKNIQQGFAENIPFKNNEFDVVFSSHVLEHVNDEQLSLKEMKRVLKDNGVLIIGMPTATMTFVRLLTELTFTTHLKIYELFRNIFSGKFLFYLNRIFSMGSHSYPRSNSIFYDFRHYKVSNWKKTVSQQFKIIKIIEPCLYPYPNYPQWFKLHKSNWGSSSVFFICKKNN